MIQMCSQKSVSLTSPSYYLEGEKKKTPQEREKAKSLTISLSTFSKYPLNQNIRHYTVHDTFNPQWEGLHFNIYDA